MTNKTFCHGNNVNNNSPGKSLVNKASTSSAQSGSSASSLSSNGIRSNDTSNPSQINSNNANIINNNNNTKLCPGGVFEGGNANGGRCGTGTAATRDGAGGIIKAYAHGIWYQEFNTIDNSVQQQIQQLQQQRQRLYQHNVRTTTMGGGGGVVEAMNVNGYLLHPDNDETRGIRQLHHQQQQQQHRQHKGNNSSNDSSNTNHLQPNNCDIVVIDIEDEPHQSSSSSPPPPPLPTLNRTINTTTITHQFLVNEPTPLRHSKQNLLLDNVIEHQVNNVAHVGTCNINRLPDDNRGAADNIIEDDDDDDDSLASMETLSDNVSIWIDGEKHWIAGVDAQTTCADLIWALLNYQNGPPEHQSSIDRRVNANTGAYCPQHHKELHQTKGWASKDTQPHCQANSAKPVPEHIGCHPPLTTPKANNQSTSINTKEENCKITQNSSRTTPATATPALTTALATKTTTAAMAVTTTAAGCNDTMLPCAPATTLPLPPGIITPAQLATEFVIVKQYHHCEEYLDGSTKVFDALPPRDSQHKKECELLLRRLGPAPTSAAYANNTTPQLSSLISTDKDSGMGSPVGSARSAKFRRRKHKSSQWLAQANTLHPRLSRCTATANERLLNIILAQDETIQRQLSLLREKERQINKIEEEKHRKRERELGKNYLLETYLNGLEEAECEPERQQGEEIFIDEAYQHLSAATSPILLPSAVQKSSAAKTFDMEMITLDNFKPKDLKKEKKKKRHKDKTSAKDEVPKKHSSASVCNRLKERADEKQLRRLNNEMANIPGSVVHNADDDEYDDDAGGGGVGVGVGEAIGSANKAETEMQIFWLEKVYTLNKQLQKEEELAAKLHAKIRKHQLKKANQTQKEVQLEIDKLDNCLALQCGDIRRVEANLMETNDQLQKKLLVLERLSLDYIHQQEAQETAKKMEDNEHSNCGQTTNFPPSVLLEKPTELQKLSLTNIKSVEEVEKLQKLIAKPSLDSTKVLCPDALAPLPPSNVGSQLSGDYPLVNNERHLISSNCSKTPLSSVLIAAKRIALKTCHDVQHQQQQEQASTTSAPSTASPTNANVAMTTSTTSVTATTTTTSLASSTSCMAATQQTTADAAAPVVVLDKNMLSSLHVQNAKTIKKQMFHAQTLSATSTALATTTTTTTPPPYPTAMATSSLLPSAAIITSQAAAAAAASANCPKASEINALALEHFDQKVSPHMVPLPLAASSTPAALITLRSQNSHHQHQQIPNIFMMARPPAAGVASLAPIQATMATAAAAAAAAITSSSTSSPASLMAMNTVDISQLGTLV